MHGEATLGVLSGPEVAAVGLYECTVDGEAHAEAGILCREKGLEESFEESVVGSFAVVPDADGDRLIALGSCDLDAPLLCRCFMHRVDGVDHEIHDHLLKLNTVAENGGQTLGEGLCQIDAVAVKLILEEGTDFSDQSIYVDGLAFAFALFQKCSKAVYDVCCPAVVADDFFEDFAGLGGGEGS